MPPVTQPKTDATTTVVKAPEVSKTPDVAAGRLREPGGNTATVETDAQAEQAERSFFRNFGKQAGQEQNDGGTAGEPEFAGVDDGPQAGAADEEPSSNGTPRLSPERAKDRANRRETELIARGILKRDGLPEAVIARILKETETKELDALVSHRRKVQRDQDALGNRLRDSQKEKPAGEGQESEDGLERTDAQQAADLAEHLRSIGDEKGAALVERGFRQEKAASSQPRGEAFDIRTARREFREELNDVKTRFPQIKGLRDEEDVLKSANRLIEAGVLEPGATVLDAIEMAAEARFGAGGRRMSQREFSERHELESNGQPDPGHEGRSSSGVGHAPATEEDADRMAYRLLQQGRNPMQVAAALSRRR